MRWNAPVAESRYAELLGLSSAATSFSALTPTEGLARRLEELAAVAGLRSGLRAAGVEHGDLQILAEDAAKQWTGTFNPRPFDQAGALEVYEQAY